MYPNHSSMCSRPNPQHSMMVIGDLKKRVPRDYPLWQIREVANRVCDHWILKNSLHGIREDAGRTTPPTHPAHGPCRTQQGTLRRIALN